MTEPDPQTSVSGSLPTTRGGPAAVVLGSTNLAKLQALKTVVAAVLPGTPVVGLAVDSGVEAQPRSDLDAVRGATTRAHAALTAAPDAAFGVGIESGVDRFDGSTFCFTWAVVVQRSGEIGRGCSARIELPPEVAKLLGRGRTLEEALIAHHGVAAGVGQRGGAMGVLTSGEVTRVDATIHALHFAFARFRVPARPAR